MKTVRIIGILALALQTAWGESGTNAAPSPRDKNKDAVRKIFQQDQEKFKGNPDLQVLPGLRADRKAGRVTLLAETTGLSKGSPVEFFLIGETSGHAYESLAVSFALPSDVHKALCFIGLEPGRPVNASKLQFWPKGERVMATMASADPAQAFGPVRIEKMVYNTRTSRVLPEMGLVFAGSREAEVPGSPGTRAYAADAREPNSIASTYNDPETVLDVASASLQKEVYGSRVANGDCLSPTGLLVEVTLEREYRDGKKRVVDLRLEAGVPAGGSAGNLADLEYHLKDPAGRDQVTHTGFKAVLECLSAFAARGQDPFVVFQPADNVPAKMMSELCAVLGSIDTEKGIRMEPPPPGHLYYRAFTPNEEFRARADRITQPWELALSLTNGQLKAVLTQIKQVWNKPDQIKADLEVQDFPVPSPDAMKKELKRITDAYETLPEKLRERTAGPIPVIFVFADPAVTCGQILSYTAPVMADYPTIHVFIAK